MTEHKDILFVFSVDTEEEWDWSGEFPSQQTGFSVTNIHELPVFHDFCTGKGIKPTYLVDYAVTTEEFSVDILRDCQSQGNCELGAHLHPWCNPPYYGKTTEALSHVVNVPIEQTKEKLLVLKEQFDKAFATQPTSFRTGRWGINGPILKLLAEQGFTVDTSVYPFYSNDYFSCDGAMPRPYWPDYDNVLKSGVQRDIIELPVTSGYNRSDFLAASRVHRFLEAPPMSYLHGVGMAWRTGLLKKIYLSPELTSAEDMIALLKAVFKSDYPVVHMYFHSSSLLPELGQKAGRSCSVAEIYERIEKVLDFIKQHKNIEFCTVTEAAQKFISA